MALVMFMLRRPNTVASVILLCITGFGAVLQQQNVILPSGDVKIGSKDYKLAANNSPKAITAINQFPVKKVASRIVFMHDVAHVCQSIRRTAFYGPCV
jgi:multidrug efflux pump subunit AcrB